MFPYQFSCGSHDWFKSHLRKHKIDKGEERSKSNPDRRQRKRCPHCDFTFARTKALEDHIRDELTKCKFRFETTQEWLHVHNLI